MRPLFIGKYIKGISKYNKGISEYIKCISEYNKCIFAALQSAGFQVYGNTDFLIFRK